MEYPQKQQTLREQELSKLEKLTGPGAEQNAYKRYLSEMVAAANDRMLADNLPAPWAAYLRRHQPSVSLESLQARSKPEASERSHEAITAQEHAEIAREIDELRNAPRSIRPSHKDERLINSLGERAERFEAKGKTQARALGLTNCAKNPHTATHYSSSGS